MADDRGSTPAGEPRARPTSGGRAEWLVAVAARFVIAIGGIVLSLFAIGWLTGVDLLRMVFDMLGSAIGSGVLVAFVALFAIGLAVRGLVWHARR